MHGSFAGINGAEWIKVIYGLILSTFLGFGMGWVTVKLVELFARRMDRRKTNGLFQRGQIAGGAAMAFMSYENNV